MDAARVSVTLLAPDDLNRSGPDEFAAALTPLFEAAAPLVNALYAARPFADYDTLLERAEAIARALPESDRIAVVNAHPRIGADPSRVSRLSYREQGYAAEGALAATEVQQTYQTLAALNAQYEQRFGFRFVVFVNQRPKAAIDAVLRARLSNSRDAELATALQEMFCIARDRLRALSR